MVEESLLETIVHILIPDKLRGLIKKSMLVREVKLIKKWNLNIQILLEFSELLIMLYDYKVRSFYSVFGSNGIFNYLIKNVGNITGKYDILIFNINLNFRFQYYSIKPSITPCLYTCLCPNCLCWVLVRLQSIEFLVHVF